MKQSFGSSLLFHRVTLLAVLALGFAAGGCAPEGTNSSASGPAVERSEPAKPVSQPNEDGTIPSGTGVEKETPAAGKGNVQGKAFFNEKPAAGVEVKLCKTFSQYMSGCGGETFTTKTDNEGEYLFKDVTPGIYEGLTIKVFDTPYYVFATSGIVSAAKYNIEEGKTYFAPDTHLFKNDLKVLSPKASAKVGPTIEVKWDEYPDAAYYKLSIHGDSSTGATTEYDYINRRVDGTSLILDKPLTPGTYTTRIEAYNANDRKLAESSRDMKFSVSGS
jgi:hypothetical protein